MNLMQEGMDLYISAELEITKSGKKYNALPKIIFSNNIKEPVPFSVKEENLEITLQNLDAQGKIDITINKSDSNSENNENGVAKAAFTVDFEIKSHISLVWIGVFLMAFGFLLSFIKRFKESAIH